MIRSEEEEHNDPLPKGAVCRAEYSYTAEYPHDLSFEEGDTLKLIGPCNKIFWYLAEDFHGNRGVVPINHLLWVDNPATTPIAPPPVDRPPLASPPVDRPPLAPPPVDRPPLAPPPVDRSPLTPPPVDRSPLTPPPMGRPSLTPPPMDRPPLAPPPVGHLLHSPPPAAFNPSIRPSREGDGSLGERPPMPPPEQPAKNPPTRPPAKYRDVLAFRANSGWCTPSVDEVLMKKAQFSNMMLFQKLRVGVYVFIHKSISNLKYVGKSYELYYELCRLFDNIYSKPISHLNPIEEQLRFHHPDASQWHVRIYSCRMDELDLTCAKRVVLMQSLAPNGLNRELVFAGREEWQSFCEWFVKERPRR